MNKFGTVLVIGANGFVGYEIVKLLYREFEVTAVDINKDKLISMMPLIKYKSVNLYNQDDLKKCFKNVDYVIHLAAKVHVTTKKPEDIKEFYKINIKASKNIFELSYKHNVKKIIFFSTSAVYGEQNWVIDETTQPNPLTLYAKTKYRAERIGLEMVKKYNLPLFILRPATIYGQHDQGNYKYLIELAQKRINIIPGDGCNYKPVIYIKDVAGVVKRLLHLQEIKIGEVFNVCENNYQYKEILEIISKVFDVKPVRIKIPLSIIDILSGNTRSELFRKLKTLSTSIEIDNRKMLNVLKYKPRYDFRSGLEDAKQYYLK